MRLALSINALPVGHSLFAERIPEASSGWASCPKHLKSRFPGAMPIKVLRDAVDLVIKSGLRKPQELIQEIHEPVSVLWQEYFPSFAHLRKNRQSYNFVTRRYDWNCADAVALPQILNERAARAMIFDQQRLWFVLSNLFQNEP